MNTTEEKQMKNPLGYKSEKGLLFQFAVPSIIAMLVGSLYNIVDQFFIGHSVGELGNAATNISFPILVYKESMCCYCTSLFGIGGASALILVYQGAQKKNAITICNIRNGKPKAITPV